MSAKVLVFVAACLLTTAPALAKPAPRPSPTEVAAANAALVADVDRDPRDTKWRYIVIHHTAAEHDSLEGISAGHATRFRDPLGIQYHFLIGNGRSAPDGAIQLARWKHRAQSIHLFHPERAPRAITVSIQGNLHERAPSPAQMLAVETLVRRLMQVYAIPVDRISTNTNADGRATVCPGKFFPIDRLLYRLAYQDSVSLADWTNPLAGVPMDGPERDLEAIRTALRWQGGCRPAVPIGPWQVLKKVADGSVEAQILGIEGGLDCTAISRRFVAIHTPDGWYTRELNGYRSSSLKLRRGKAFAVLVRDERGPMQTCAWSGRGAPVCTLVPPAKP
ncbi:MAG: N-acetylmuramoyl-L-alanine amidase [Deltaproteobacteria bacterium]|nr:N-acetylmuramoyl-L-alanine amidase [Deltaproteobacteria bacterium]